MTEYKDGYWTTADDLRLHYRDYPGRADRLPVVCLHGLTRNARDFADLAESLAGERRVIVPEHRGRAESEYAKDATTYNPPQYVEDVIQLLDELGIDRFVSVGTSLGGIMTFIIGATRPDRLAGAVINDIGPYIEPEGLAVIFKYVGQGRSFETWVHAARALEEVHVRAHPTFELADWIAMAKRLMALGGNGRIVFDYDIKIAELFNTIDPDNQPDGWPAVDALAGKPVLIVRGELSDVFSAETMDKMLARLPDAEGISLPDVGHAPLLDEPGVAEAIDRLLARTG